jgi:hypothetical protein
MDHMYACLKNMNRSDLVQASLPPVGRSGVVMRCTAVDWGKLYKYYLAHQPSVLVLKLDDVVTNY